MAAFPVKPKSAIACRQQADKKRMLIIHSEPVRTFDLVV
jgi:hypothetical protein